MLPTPRGEFFRTCANDPNAAKLVKHRGVYWLSCSLTDDTDGAPLPNPRTAPISVRDPDATPMPLEESEETRRPKHRALPANVSKEEFDSHQLTHLPFRSWCDHCVRGKAVDDAHRPRIDPDRGEAKMCMDNFVARATDPQHAKAVLNCLDLQSGAVFSAMVVKGGDPYALACDSATHVDTRRWLRLEPQIRAQNLPFHECPHQNRCPPSCVRRRAR